MTTPPSDTPESQPAADPAQPPTASHAQVARAVFWSFFGVRKGEDLRRDAATIKPLHVIIVGVASALVFVLALIALVSFITRNA